MLIRVSLYPFIALKPVAPYLCRAWTAPSIACYMGNKFYDHLSIFDNHSLKLFAVTQIDIGDIGRLTIFENNSFQISKIACRTLSMVKNDGNSIYHSIIDHIDRRGYTLGVL